MCAIVKNTTNGKYIAFVKGSPEKMATKCMRSSIPIDFLEKLQVYTEQGFRVIALSYKELNMTSNEEVQKALRDSVETDLHFLGFLIMENKLKAVTSEAIQTLNDCNIRTMMATGDNLQTAICVARNCNILQGDQEIFLADIEDGAVVWRSTQREDALRRRSTKRKSTFKGRDYDAPSYEMASR